MLDLAIWYLCSNGLVNTTNDSESSDLFSMRISNGVFPRLLIMYVASIRGVENNLTSPAVVVPLEVLSYTSNKLGGNGAQHTKWSGRFQLGSASRKWLLCLDAY